MPLSQALRKLTEAGLLTTLTPRPPPQSIPPQFRMDLHCAYHQGPGHENRSMHRFEACRSGFDRPGLVHLGQPSVTTNPLPAHTTHAVPPPADGIHFLEFDEIDDHIHMLSDDDPNPEPIMPDVIMRSVGIQTPFVLVPDVEEFQAPHSDDPQTPDVQYILRGGRVLRQPPPAAAARPLGVHHPRRSTHRDALTRALSQIRVDTTTTPERLIHMMTVGRATCIVFFDDDLPPEGSDHTRPLYISVGFSGRRVPSVLLDNGSALNICFLATAIALGYAPSDFSPSTQTVRAYDSTWREVMGTLEIELLIGPTPFVTVFQVLRIPTSFNLLLGRPWIHRAGAIPSSLHQKVKFIHDGQVIVVQSVEDMFIAAEPVLEISHTDDDLFLTGFTFDEVQTVEIEDFCRDFVANVLLISMGAQWCSILCGACPIYPAWGWVNVSMDRASSSPFLIMTERVKARLTHTSFYYPVRPYTMSLADYFVRASEPHAPSDGIIIGDIVDGAVPRDEYVDEMLVMSLGQTEEIAPPELASPFDLFGVSVLEIAGEIQVAPTPEVVEDVIVVVDLFDGPVGLVEGATFEYLPVSHVIDLSAPSSPTSQIFDIDDEIAQHDSDDDSSSTSDSDPVDQRVSPAVKEEIQKQLSVGFLSVVEYPEWLANVVPVPKKDGKVRVCVDFRDLNKASPKDDFPLPHIDMLVDNLDAPEDMEKTSFITEWGTYCYRVMPFGLKNAGATYQRAATTLFHDMMHRDVETVQIETESQEVPFGVTSGKLLGYMVSERGIEVDPDKIRAILDMPAPRTERECQRAFERIREYLLSPPVLAPPTPGHPLLLYLSVSDVALGCMLAQLDDSGKDRAIYYLSKRMLDYETSRSPHEMVVLLTEFDIHYVTQKSIRGSIVADHLASLPVSDARAIDDDFPDEDVAAVTSLSGWRMYFDGAANHSGYGIGVLLISPHGDHIPRSVRLAFSDRHPATNNIVEYEACILGLETALELGIRQMEVFGDSNLVLRQIQGEWKTRDVKLKPYHAYLELLVGRFDDLRYTHLLERRTKPDDGLPWYHDIYHFLRLGVYPEAATAKDKRALRQLAARFVICGETLYRRSPDGMLLLCLDRTSADRVMREVHAGVCGPHMGGHMLAIHGDLIHVPPPSLHALTSPWPFSVWGIDIIGKISPKSSSGHEFILVAIDYFTKWVEAASGVHFRAEVDTLVQRYSIRHHRSSAYRPQTNGAVEAANKNIKRILRRMVETSRDWSEKLPFALWAYRTSFRTSTGATPYSLVYGMEAMLPVEIEMGSLRVALEQQIPEADWAQARFDQLNLLDERRLRAADHVRAYQRKMARAFKKRVKPRPLRIGDLVLKVIRGLIRDPRGKFRPNWSGPYFIRELTPEGAAWLMDLDGNRFSEPTNVDQLKSDPSRVRYFASSLHISLYSSFCFICLLIDIIFTLGILSFLSFLSPYHLGLRYVPCLKTTLRPWDQMSSSQPLLGQVIEIWIVSLMMIDLVSPDFLTYHTSGATLGISHFIWRFMDPHGLARSSLTGCSSRRGHDRYLTEPLRSIQQVRTSRHLDAIMPLHLGDDFMSPDFRPRASMPYWGIFPFWPWRRSFSRISVTVSITRSRYIVFASLTIIPELFIDMSSQRSIVRDS
ncbi:Transposon Ty3-I Gag-Pol polyprotein [Vitis vinifera]|uniref:Transposon Ty3-I Gag-Pol polyprotein n=1 Tax=Vitis vinifera TaxID=29760 RepID=A0A438DLT4_VITVI|nr:Transposon Ty3-I Gag-Pol polyprotein [Vitis vinifera]